MTCYKVGMITYVQILAAHTPNFGKAKTLKIRRDFGQILTLTTNILGTDRSPRYRKSETNLMDSLFLLKHAKNKFFCATRSRDNCTVSR